MSDLHKKIKNTIAAHEDILLLDGFDDAFIGVARQFGFPIAVYDKCKCLEIISKQMNISNVVEYFNYNLDGNYMGEGAPVFMECNNIL